MSRYQVPARSTVYFELGSVSGINYQAPSSPNQKGMSAEEFNAKRVLLLEQFGLRLREPECCTLRYGDKRWPEFVAALRSEYERRSLWLDACWIEQPPIARAGSAEWFRVEPDAREIKSFARPPMGVHYCWSKHGPLVSETFVEVTRHSALRGLEMVPVEESRRIGGITWYQPIAMEPLGRGLDHPAVDPIKMLPENVRHRCDRAFRSGEPCAWRHLWREDAFDTDGLVVGLASLCATRFRSFRVVEVARFVREHLPETDFAYAGWGSIEHTPEGWCGLRSRDVYCNAKARSVLIDAGLVKPSRFIAVDVVAAEDAQSEILDRTVAVPLPPPALTRGEIEAARAKPAAAVQVTAVKRESVPFETIHAELAARQTAGTLPWNPASSDPDYAEVMAGRLWKKCPQRWREIAPLMPIDLGTRNEQGEELEFLFHAPEPNLWTTSPSDDRPADERPLKTDIVIGATSDGNWYAIRPSDPLMPLDARVVLWDHETTTVADEWPSVGDFAAFLLRRADASPPTGDDEDQ